MKALAKSDGLSNLRALVLWDGLWGGRFTAAGVKLVLESDRFPLLNELRLTGAHDYAVTGHALAVLGFRMTLQALAGADPSGSEAAVRKLLGVQHDQHTQEVGMALMGADAAATDGEAGAWSSAFLFNRCLTIAGGTSDVQRNVIAERLLGLPRDPEPGA